MEGNWSDQRVFKRKQNKARTVLKLQKQFAQALIQHALSESDRRLVPIVMFAHNCHWVEFVCVVRIVDGVDIGIALVLDPSDAQQMRVMGIHLDPRYIYEQHILTSPQHIGECECLRGWTSNIDDIEFCGNIDDEQNAIIDLSQKYHTLKAFVQSFINTKDTESTTELKQHAALLIQYQNGNSRR